MKALLTTDEAADALALSRTMVSNLILAAGLRSTRNYDIVLEPAEQAISEVSSPTSHSAVRSRFVVATRKGVARLRSPPLGDRRWLVIYIDGFVLR